MFNSQLKFQISTALLTLIAFTSLVAPAQARIQDPGDIKVLTVTGPGLSLPIYIQEDGNGQIAKIKATLEGTKYAAAPGKTIEQKVKSPVGDVSLTIDAQKLTASGGEIKVQAKKGFIRERFSLRIAKENGEWKVKDSKGKTITNAHIKINLTGIDVILASLNPATAPGERGDVRVSSVAMASAKTSGGDFGEQFVGDHSLDKRAISSGSAI